MRATPATCPRGLCAERAGSDVLEETTLSGTATNDYIFFGGKRIARRDASGNVFPYFADHLGSSRKIEEVAAGASTASPCYDADFYPYGREHAFTNSCPQNYKFTGKERDGESGLDYFGARYYANSLGRFMSPDPLLNSGRPSNPQTWNRYAYARNNPLAIVDPTGLYDLKNTCKADDRKCNKQFNQHARDLKNGLTNLQKQVDKMKDGPEKQRLEASLKALGTEGDNNNVNVKFGALSGSAAGDTKTVYDEKTGGLSFNITFDPGKISGGTNYWGIDAAHEGTHVSDISDPRYANSATTLSDFSLEYRGYQTSAWAAQALGVSPLAYDGGTNVIWNSGWAAADRQTLMDKGITQHVTSIPGHPETTPHNPWPN
jgi:RHS repeat-associated protein